MMMMTVFTLIIDSMDNSMKRLTDVWRENNIFLNDGQIEQMLTNFFFANESGNLPKLQSVPVYISEAFVMRSMIMWRVVVKMMIGLNPII